MSPFLSLLKTRLLTPPPPATYPPLISRRKIWQTVMITYGLIFPSTSMTVAECVFVPAVCVSVCVSVYACVSVCLCQCVSVSAYVCMNRPRLHLHTRTRFHKIFLSQRLSSDPHTHSPRMHQKPPSSRSDTYLKKRNTQQLATA